MRTLSNSNSHEIGAVRGGGFALLIAAFAMALLTACDAPTGPGPVPPGVDPTETPTPTPTPAPETPTPTPTPTPPDEPSETVPVIQSFVADPLTIDEGDSSTLSWEVEDATSVEIDHGIGDVSLSGTRSVSPSSTTTYTLTAHGTGGDATATAQVKVNAKPICVPSLISPANGAKLDNARYDQLDNRVWNFDWSNCAGATQYHLYVRRSSSASATIDEDDLASSNYQFVREWADAHLTGWKWKVRAKVGGVWGAWSPERSFTLEEPNSDPAPSSDIGATISFYKFDSSSKWITFKVKNTGAAWLECVEAHIQERVTDDSLYGPSYSNAPFFSSPTQTSGGNERMSSGGSQYLRYKLTEKPSMLFGIKANFKVYSVDNKVGPSKSMTMNVHTW
jgi:hypothetical protein